MLVSQLVSNIKRKAQYGDVSVTSDTVTSDIIAFLNNRMYEVWRKWPWEWSLYAVSFDTVVGTTDYTLNSNAGAILALTAGTGGYLKVLSWKRYLDWFINNQVDPVTGIATVPANGNVTHYVKIGRDSSGNLKIRLWRPPSEVVSITGFGKQRITAVTVADIAAGTSIAYFPPEHQTVLENGVLADVYESMGQKDMALAKESLFKEQIEELKGDQADNADVDPTTAPPDSYVFRKRKRGGSTVA